MRTPQPNRLFSHINMPRLWDSWTWVNCFSLLLLFLIIGIRPSYADDQDGWHFIWPNEMQPQKMWNITRQVQPGVILSVGTERGFILGAQIAHSTNNSPLNHLVLLDYNQNVNLINRYNVALLDLSLVDNLADYMHLRLNASFEEIQDALSSRVVSDETAQILSSSSNFFKWKRRVRNAGSNFVWEKFYNPPRTSMIPLRRIRARQFSESVYLHDEPLFFAIQALAKSGRIRVTQTDLTSDKDLDDIRDWIEESRLPLSILDISNAWQRRYMNRQLLEKLISSFEKVANNKSVLQITGHASLIETLLTMDIESGDSMAPWNYTGYTFGYIRKWSSISKFVKFLRYFGPISKPRNTLKSYESAYENRCSELFL